MKYIYFTYLGNNYRTTDATFVERQDGAKWNRTGSIPVILEARKAVAANA